MCCRGGRVVLPALLPPPVLLYHLLTQQHPNARRFRERIRVYNASLNMASSSVRTLRQFEQGVEVVRVNAMVAHKMGSLYPPAGRRPVCAQVYVLDSASQLEARLQLSWARDLSHVVACIFVMQPFVCTLGRGWGGVFVFTGRSFLFKAVA